MKSVTGKTQPGQWKSPEILGRKLVFPVVYSLCLGVVGKWVLLGSRFVSLFCFVFSASMRGLTDMFSVLRTCENYRNVVVSFF